MVNEIVNGCEHRRHFKIHCLKKSVSFFCQPIISFSERANPFR